MSFVDLVGIGADRVGKDMNLSATLSQFIPSVTFLWFLILSIPAGILQSRYGKRFMLNVGIGITALGLFMPFFFYSFRIVLLGFTLLGIGNTIVQVSANPLLVDVVPTNRVTSFLSFSQFVKAIGSMIGAPLAAVLSAHFLHDWKIVFLIFGVVSVFTAIWLGSVKIEESKTNSAVATFSSSLSLLRIVFILVMILSIFFVVGIDVGFNSNSGNFLVKRFGVDKTAAESGRSVYFLGRMVGTLAGSILLTKISSRRFFVWNSILGIICLTAFLVVSSQLLAWVIVFLIGLAIANIFPIIYSIAVEKFPERANEISGLIIMSVSGGALIPLLAGWLTDIMSVIAGVSVLIICMLYILAVSFYCLKK